MSVIYLDYNRTTPLAPSVLEAMQPYWSTHFLLPGQEHTYAQAVSEALDHAREGVAMMSGCESFEIVFTGGGTESNKQAIMGGLAGHDPGHILVSALEHQSVLDAATSLARSGWEIEIIDCDHDGMIDPDQAFQMCRENTRLVCIQAANPVLGTIQPVREIADRFHNRGVSIHCDATQVFGKIPIDVGELRADTVAISGHKFYGPKGSGALYVRRGLQVAPIAYGEPREMGLRPGAENVPACVGLGAAARLASKCVEQVESNFQELRERFIQGLQKVVDPDPILICEESPRLPNTVTIELASDAKSIQKSARQLVVATAQSDAPPDEMTRCLRAVGRSIPGISRTLRFSFGWTTSRDEIDRTIELIAEASDVG